MEFLETIKNRRTIRKFLDLPVEWEKVTDLLMAGHYAPSAGNLQNWRFIVVTDKNQRRNVADACLQQYWIEEAPVSIIICSNTKEMTRHFSDRGNKYDVQSACAAAENMLLTAENNGLGSAWIGNFEEDLLKSSLSIPKNVAVHAVLVFGYADEKPPMPQKFNIGDISYINSWDNKIVNMDLVFENWGAVVSKATKDVISATSQESKPFIQKAKEKAKRHIETIKSKINERKNNNK